MRVDTSRAWTQPPNWRLLRIEHRSLAPARRPTYAARCAMVVPKTMCGILPSHLSPRQAKSPPPGPQQTACQQGTCVKAEYWDHTGTGDLSARRKGKDVAVTAFAWYAARQALSGRHLWGFSSTDALLETKLARRRFGAHVGISAVGEDFTSFYQVFGDRRARWTALELVGPKIDWDEFIGGCDQRDQRIAQMKLAGCPQTEIAADLGVSCPAVSLRLRALRRRWDIQAVT